MKKILYVIMLFILLLCSCTTTKIKEVPIETIKTEYIQNTKIDSVFVKDSIDRWIKGDTLYIYKERTKYKYINKVDTVCRSDTITKVVTVTEIERVEVNHIKWYQETLMWIGGVLLVLVGLGLIIKLKKLWI